MIGRQRIAFSIQRWLAPPETIWRFQLPSQELTTKEAIVHHDRVALCLCSWQIGQFEPHLRNRWPLARQRRERMPIDSHRFHSAERLTSGSYTHLRTRGLGPTARHRLLAQTGQTIRSNSYRKQALDGIAQWATHGPMLDQVHRLRVPS